MKNGPSRKALSLFASFIFLFNSFSPYIGVVLNNRATVFAEDVTSTPSVEPTPSVTPETTT